MEETLKIIRDLGVPIAMLLWFMFRMEKRLDALQAGQTESNGLLKQIVSKE